MSEMAGPFHRGDTMINKHFTLFYFVLIESVQDKIYAPSKDSDQSGHSPTSLIRVFSGCV